VYTPFHHSIETTTDKHISQLRARGAGYLHRDSGKRYIYSHGKYLQAIPIALGYITDKLLTTVTKPVSLRIFTTVGASVCARCKRPVDVDVVSKIVVVDATVLLAALLLVPVITILLLARLLTVVAPKSSRPTPST
jgi:hypothetical protein